jgi:type IV pilus assembly protein PilA
MIVVAIIAIILSLALPVYTDYTTRAKVGEALSVGAAAKTAVAASCIEDPTIDPLSNAKAGYAFTPSKYVFSVTAGGPCSDPVITVVTQNTGVAPAIILTLTGNLNAGRARIDWLCTSNTANNNVPTECRT